MDIFVTVKINDNLPTVLRIETPDDLISTYSVEDMVKDFVGDRLILAGYPMVKKEKR